MTIKQHSAGRLKWMLLGLLTLALLLSQSVIATTYYVDATDGNNANNGLTPGTAWQTLAGVSGKALNAGDSVLFQRGETWTGTYLVGYSGSAGNVITFSDYDTGNKPVISNVGATRCFDIRNRSFLKINNFTITPTTGEAIFLYNTCANIEVDSCDITGGGNAVSILTGVFSSITISNTNISTYASVGIRLNLTTMTGLTLDNVTLDGNSVSNAIGFLINAGSCSNISITNSSFSRHAGSGNGIYFVSASVVSNLSVDSITLSNNVGYAIYLLGALSNASFNKVYSYSNTNSGFNLNKASGVRPDTITIDSSIFRDNGSDGLQLAGLGDSITIRNTISSNNGGDGFNVHNDWAYITIERCVADSNGGAGGGGDAYSFHETSMGIIRYCIARNNDKSAVGNADASSCLIYYNLFSHTTNGTIALVYVSSSDTHNVYNNVIYSGGNVGNGVQNQNGRLVLRNNSIQGFVNGVVQTSGTIDDDYNNVYGASTANWSGVSAGSHSISIDPRYFTPPTDFTLRKGSRNINRGIGISGLTVDYRGYTFRGAPDIGAYEMYYTNESGQINGFCRGAWGR